MDNSLRKLRKEAGYSSAAKFAEEVGIPAPTYARYEQADDGPETSMPLKNAWAIADKLGCSIDHIVGREHVETDQMRGEVQKFYDGLSDENKRLFNKFARFIASEEEEAKRKKKAAEDRQYEQYARYYEKMMYQAADIDDAMGESVIFGTPSEIRCQFQTFVTERAYHKRLGELDDVCDSLSCDLQNGMEVQVGDDRHTVSFDRDAPDYDVDLIFGIVETERERLERKFEKRDEEVIAKIMEAYDRLYPESADSLVAESDYIYAFVTLNDD